MTETDLNPDPLADLIRDGGRPVHLNVLTRHAVRTWLEARAEERHYAPGGQYKPGECIRFRGQRSIVTNVLPASNPVQGDFSILTIRLPDDTERLMAADIPDAPVERQQQVTQEAVDAYLDTKGEEARAAVREALKSDARFVSCSTPRGELWCLRDMVPKVTPDEVRSAEAILPRELVNSELISHATEELTAVIWGLDDDGSHDYALCAFALSRALDAREAVLNLGDRWAHAEAWEALRAERETLTSPRQPSDIEIPKGLPEPSAAEIQEEDMRELAEREIAEEDEPEKGTKEQRDLESWRRDHPDHAVLTLRARHYYEGWLPLSTKVKRLFPPLSSGQQEVIFYHHFGDEPESFRAWVDWEQDRIWVSAGMYETFRGYGIYPGARLRISARNERAFDLATREADKSEPIRVWRMWLNEEREIEYDDFEEPRRYDTDDDVYVADARFEDLEALFRQAEETGNSIFGLMYEEAVARWKAKGREDLVVTADELHEAIHFDEQGRMVSKASIKWELWKRLAFKPLGGGRYLFQPRFGAAVRSAAPVQPVERSEPEGPPEARAYFIFQQRPDSEYADQAGEIYNWRQGIPGSNQIVEGARFIYYRPGEQVFFGTGRVARIESYTGDDGETYHDGHITNYEPWEPPLHLTTDLAERVSFIQPDRLGVGQAGIRKVSQEDFGTITSAHSGLVQEPAGLSRLWSWTRELEGRTLHTLAQKRPFDVTRVTDRVLSIEIKEGTSSSLSRADLERAWGQLVTEGEISLSDLDQYVTFNSSYAAAILAGLADVEHSLRPIRLSYSPEAEKAPAAAGAADRERTGRIEYRDVSAEDFSMGIADEVINIRALRAGEQIVLCKKHRKSNNRIFLLPKVSFASDFEPSEAGRQYLQKPIERDTTRHIAEIEYLPIPGRERPFWKDLFERGEFNLWDVDAGPLLYFEGADDSETLFWILRVFELPFNLEEGVDFERGPHGHASIMDDRSLTRIQTAFAQGRCEPILEDAEFQRRRQAIASVARHHREVAAAEAGSELQEEEAAEGQRRLDLDAEFEEIRAIVEESLVGETIYTLAQGKPNQILDSDNEGLTVLARTESTVRWVWIRDVYEALCHLGEIEAKDVQEGEFQTPGGYRNAFIFALLARFAHVEARTDPRRMIYHQPDGPIRLEDAGEDAEDAVEEPPSEPSPPSASGPSSSGPSRPYSRPSGRKPSSREADDMQTKTLFSQHYLQNRLPDHDEWQEDPWPVFKAVRELWGRAQTYGDAWNEAQTEQEFIQPMLEILGWATIVQPSAHHAGRIKRPDYALFPDETGKDDAMEHQGDDDAFYSRAPAIAEAKYWGRPLSQKDPSGRETWDSQSNPSHQMVSYLVGTGVGWGILTNGRVWRLYSREVSSTASEYYEVDLGLIFDGVPDEEEAKAGQIVELMDQFRRWWLFFRQRSFEADAQGRSFVERVQEGSDTYARRISDTLKRLVYDEVMPEIAGGFVAYRHHQKGIEEETEETLRRIYRASLSLLYKLLFLLYGEARSLLPVSNPGYREQSLTTMAQWAAERLDEGLPISEATHATSRYDTLMALFHRIDQGDPSLGIPRYDGGLFDPSSPENHFLEAHKLSDGAVARAIDTLVRDAGEPVDYAYIGVQNLGSIYEGLLENRLRVVDAAAGEVELIGDKVERKATGSYYTPDYIVEYIVQHTLDPILEERDEAFREAMDRCADLRDQMQRLSDTATIRRLRGELDGAERDAREAFLGIRVVDPAMGSGHFLVNAVDHLTDAVIRRMQVYHDEHPDVLWDWNPIQRLVDQVRGAILAEMERQGIQVDPVRLDDTALLTRLVMKRCIYGVDLNRMAVELAKVSLWLHTFTVGAPLSFLDHHLRWGNSLIGTDVRTVEQEIERTEAGQMSLWQGPFAGLLDLTGLMVEVVERADATLADVQQSAQDFRQFQKELTPYKQVLDLWVSQYFGNEDAFEFITLYGDDVLPAVKRDMQVGEPYRSAIEGARALYEEKRFFHWDLEFPEVFIDLPKRDWAENPGFDAVIGNPPYVRSVNLKEVDPETWAYYGQAYRVATKREFDIYLCFVERGLDLLNAQGHFGMILPNKWFTTRVGESLRGLLSAQRAVKHVVDFGHLQVFGGVTTYTCLLFLGRSPCDAARVAILDEAREDAQPLPGAEGKWQRDHIPCEALGAGAWVFALGPAGALLDRLGKLEDLDEIANVFMGTGTRADSVFFMERQGVRFYSRSLEKWVEIEDDLMRPSLTGKDIDRYRYNSDNYVLFPYRVAGEDARLIPPDEMATEYPEAWAYLRQEANREILEGRDKGAFRDRDDWYAYGRPQNMDLLARRKIVGPDVAGQAEFACDLEGRYIIDTAYAVRTKERVRISLLALTALLNSPLMTFYLEQTGTDLRGGYFRMKTAYLNPFPLPRIAFITPDEERERLVAVGTNEATERIEATEAGSVASVSFSAFSGSDLGRWLDERLSPVHTPDLALVREHNADPLNEDWQLPEEGPVEQSDVVHDLLAQLAERMIEMHKERQARIERFWLDLEGVTQPSVFEALHEHGKWESSLWKAQPCRDFVDEKSRSTVHLDKSLGWNEACFKAFVKMLAGNVSNLSDVVSVYRQHHPAYRQLVQRIAATDRLIDLIVYRLYGLTEEEVAVVEGGSS